MAPTSFLLVRHGETLWNSELRYQGHQPVALSAKGVREAVCLRDRLAGRKVDGIYASDLPRAFQTAEIIAGAHPQVEVVPDSALRELNWGKFEGLTYAEIEERFPKEIVAWRNDRMRCGPPGGENLMQLADRVIPRLREISERHQGQTVLIVAHSGPLRVFICSCLGLGLDRYWQMPLDNASLSIVESYNEGAILTLFNDVCHCKDEA